MLGKLTIITEFMVLTFPARYVVWQNHPAIRTDLAVDCHSCNRTSYL